VNYHAATLLRSLAGGLLAGIGSLIEFSWLDAGRGHDRPLAGGCRPADRRRLDQAATANISRGNVAIG
jgi:hypothetical protein